jgi:hypothetical protein
MIIAYTYRPTQITGLDVAFEKPPDLAQSDVMHGVEKDTRVSVNINGTQSTFSRDRIDRRTRRGSIADYWPRRAASTHRLTGLRTGRIVN